MGQVVGRTAQKGVAFGAGTAGGLALAALLLPQIASTLKPTDLGAALLAIAIALLTTIGQRLIERYSQRRALENALRAWPPQRLGAADPATLGVYPAIGPGGRPEPYRPRDEDPDLRRALEESKIVVVHGPSGAGKSRAAAEAGRRVLAGVPAIVPLNADALRSLADGSVRVRLDEPSICLWLDGLDRFVEAIDARALQSLGKVAREVRIVATIRTEKWTELLSGSGQQSEAARALAAGGTVIELTPLDSVTGQPAPDTVDAARALSPVRKVAPRWRDPWLGSLGLGLLATLIVGLFAGLSGNLVKPRPLDEQMDEIKSAALRGDANGRRHVVVDARVRFHSTEADSWVLVIEDRPSHDDFYSVASGNVKGPLPRSDELRIYDVSDGRLRLKLRFRPKPIKSGDEQHPSGLVKLGAGAALATDYDDDGSNELIAGYSIPAEATQAFVPFGIDWEDGRYQLVSLVPQRPRLSDRGLTAKAVAFRHEAYEERRTFQNEIRDRSFRHLALTGFRVQAFAYVEKPRTRLLTGYFAMDPETSPKRVVELHAGQFRTGALAVQPCTPTYAACQAPARAQEVTVPPDRGLDGGLLAAWDAIGSKWVKELRATESNRPAAEN